LTIHGRSRYPGLNIWARNTGKRIPVVFPKEGKFLLVQAGKQLEHLTGGLIKAGYHEVVVNDATLAVSCPPVMAIVNLLIFDHMDFQAVGRRAEAYPDRPQIRISSTFFYHLSSDFDLFPIENLAQKALEYDAVPTGMLDKGVQPTVYEKMKVGQQVQK